MQATHTHTHPFYGPLDFVQDYPGKPVPEPIWILLPGNTHLWNNPPCVYWQWHQLGHMQICTSPQTDNHTSTHHSGFYRPVLQAGCPSYRQTNSVKALNECKQHTHTHTTVLLLLWTSIQVLWSGMRATRMSSWVNLSVSGQPSEGQRINCWIRAPPLGGGDHVTSSGLTSLHGRVSVWVWFWVGCLSDRTSIYYRHLCTALYLHLLYFIYFIRLVASLSTHRTLS